MQRGRGIPRLPCAGCWRVAVVGSDGLHSWTRCSHVASWPPPTDLFCPDPINRSTLAPSWQRGCTISALPSVMLPVLVRDASAEICFVRTSETKLSLWWPARMAKSRTEEDSRTAISTVPGGSVAPVRIPPLMLVPFAARSFAIASAPTGRGSVWRRRSNVRAAIQPLGR